jgi:hypothetical protein
VPPGVRQRRERPSLPRVLRAVRQRRGKA